MKKLFSALLAAIMLFCMTGPAFAAEADPPPVEDEQFPAAETISTADGLKAALAAADDGDTVTISQTIIVTDESLVTDKHITIALADDFTDINGVLEMRGESIVDGLTFPDSFNSVIVIREGEATIKNCTFTASGEKSHITIFGDSSALIEDCRFENAKDSAISNMANTDTIVKSCIILNNSSATQGGAIYNGGTLTVSDTLISENTAVSGGGICNSYDSILTLSNCNIYGNTATADFATDILSFGKLSIEGRASESEGLYNEDTGEKLTLPLTDYTSTAKLIYLTDDEAATRFASDLPAVDEPQEDEQSPVEKQTTENPLPDNTTTEQDTPTVDEPPTEIEDKENNDGPSIVYVPVYIPSRPHNSTSTTTTTTAETETKNTTVAAASAPVFACGNAVIDVTRSVVLEGYSDGLLHLEDSLTRAQMATIIYRLLDADTLAKYDRATSNFTDVSPTAWYSRYVSTIANAGIVSGVGNDCYNPDGKLTWAHILTVLSRFVEPTTYALQNIQYSGWALQSVQTAVALGWIGDYANFNPDAVITRGEFQQLVNGVLGLYRTI